MTDPIAEIRQRRDQLIARSALLRDEVHGLARPWFSPIAAVDRIVAMGRRIRENPLIIPVALMLLYAMRRGRFGVWAGRLLTLWQLYQSVQASRHPGR